MAQMLLMTQLAMKLKCDEMRNLIALSRISALIGTTHPRSPHYESRKTAIEVRRRLQCRHRSVFRRSGASLMASISAVPRTMKNRCLQLFASLDAAVAMMQI